MYQNTLKHLTSAIRSISNNRPVSKTTINLSVLENPFDRCRDFKEFKQMLSQMILTGFIKDTFAAKRLLQLSTNDDLPFIHLDYFYQIFNFIENPDASIYNIMMMAYVARNYPHRAIPFTSLWSMRSGYEDEAEYFYNLIAEKEKDTIASHFMIVNFRRSCSFEKHDKLINEIPDNDTDSWSGLIYRYMEINREMYEEAFELFIRMHADGITIDELVVEVILICFVKFVRRRHVEMMGKLIHSLVVKMGIECDVELQNDLIGMYSACGQIMSAQKLLNAACWLSEFGSCLMLRGYVKCGLLEDAKALFESMPKKTFAQSWVEMISGYARHSCFFESLAIFQEMMHSGIRIRLDEEDLCRIINDLPDDFAALDLGKCIHAYLIKNGYTLQFRERLSTALSRMYSSCGYKVMRYKEGPFTGTVSPDPDININWNIVCNPISLPLWILEDLFPSRSCSLVGAYWIR
ncbi:hypothetical protein FNV43_RR03074 [Rhamnella rubrinervis]|uniref:Pentatricopeptide repeat-containing protein n=1 Tax=Rhamnella rubrinervis TaxID=2594499 RepID=A0A8K0HH35_9ROSA|nr:hypothetical protein FNV43_RR03074 [Rhamnella rubrinervis]